MATGIFAAARAYAEAVRAGNVGNELEALGRAALRAVARGEATWAGVEAIEARAREAIVQVAAPGYDNLDPTDATELANGTLDLCRAIRAVAADSKCKRCGGDIHPANGGGITICPACGVHNGSPPSDALAMAALWQLAERLNPELGPNQRRLCAEARADLAAALMELEGRRKDRYPRVGVAVLLRRPSDGALLFGLRKGSHGAGTWSTPGGKLDAGESVVECAARELLEETGIAVEVANLRALDVWTLNHFEAPIPDYVTLWVAGQLPDGAEPRAMEPDRCGGWRWAAPGELPDPLFGCLGELVARGLDPWTAWPSIDVIGYTRKEDPSTGEYLYFRHVGVRADAIAEAAK